MSDSRCVDCIYYVPVSAHTNHPMGLCYFHPPIPLRNESTNRVTHYRPEVAGFDFCALFIRDNKE